ncbi:16S rRNA m(2)G 1207 methyltransferase [Roseovarius nanhaiticus]|uniref:16S rRNA m(2)G 1207 methyltransferase n=1 Tax=Roseovarius nanhaiticus TaxID=573024 RepID=A0A1N7EES7_9RHOB|nr:methyltransferase [Roseovarius nanhaiticus]SEK76230.1 16S rRNA (guanine1207-N2)-methyltransferase [Roseovarius nanhaiticus]SIR86529.1 16S rRNA m(2)G 1207 methyltransferase [Roseovarius nanhaiticus]
MTGIRLSLALHGGGLSLPDGARIAVFAPTPDSDLSELPQDLCHVITGTKPDSDYFAALGYTCNTAPEGRYGASLVCLPRAKDRARALIAEAADVTDGPVIVDGLKTDGIESAMKACRKQADGVSGPINKAHGKLFWMDPAPELAGWRMGEPGEIEGGYVTAPGVFSADGIDPASQALADNLPETLGAHVIDLGAGWGYLTQRALERDSIRRIDAIEADHAALACARLNVTDPRAYLHWEDALRWRPETGADTVIMNPPFHTARKADPALGRAFIAAAAEMLKPSGQLWMVANRHLPYEQTLAGLFSDVSEAPGGDTRFKLLHARRPMRKKR